MTTYTAKNLEELRAVAAEVLTALPPQPHATILTLSGDLGAGKTAFTKVLARELGVMEHVTSPTFGIMSSYKIEGHKDFDQLVHIDAYRIEDISEAGPLRLTELFTDPQNLVVIEWPERIADILPKEKIDVEIVIKEGETREVAVKH